MEQKCICVSVLGFSFILCLSKSALLLLHTNELLETLSFPFLASLCFPACWKCGVYTELFWCSLDLHGSSSLILYELMSQHPVSTFEKQNIGYCWDVVGCRLLTLPPLSSTPTSSLGASWGSSPGPTLGSFFIFSTSTNSKSALWSNAQRKWEMWAQLWKPH